MVLIGLALFLTFFVMQPVMNDAWTTGILPLSEGRVGELEGLRLASEPFRRFMTANLRRPTCSSFSTSRTCRHRRRLMTRRGAHWCPRSWWASCGVHSRWGSCSSCPS